jgi:hypothetical protein
LGWRTILLLVDDSVFVFVSVELFVDLERNTRRRGSAILVAAGFVAIVEAREKNTRSSSSRSDAEATLARPRIQKDGTPTTKNPATSASSSNLQQTLGRRSPRQ